MAAGMGTGSSFSLEFEPRIPRQAALTNPHLTELQRTTRADFAVLVHCAWRLDSASEVICGSEDEESAGGKMLQGLALLPGQELQAATISLPAVDAALRFGEHTLRIFCSKVSEPEELDNYVLYGPDRILCVGPRSRVYAEAPGLQLSRSLRLVRGDREAT